MIRGTRVGLLGGSFDPPHSGHVHLSREAMKRFRLDRVVWLVSPGNPLKPNPPAPLQQRLEAARDLTAAPWLEISDLEARISSRYTAQTLRHVTRRWPATRFVWLMGADNMAQLHRWDNWRDIMRTVPIGVLARPGYRLAARMSPAARAFASARMPERAARCLPDRIAPAWCYVTMPLHPASSSALRAEGNWHG